MLSTLNILYSAFSSVNALYIPTLISEIFCMFLLWTNSKKTKMHCHEKLNLGLMGLTEETNFWINYASQHKAFLQERSLRFNCKV